MLARARSLLRSEVFWGVVGVVACALLAASSLLTTAGLPNTSDGVLHLFRSLELASAWREGVLYPRWAPHFALGFGYPIFNYVPPLLSYLSGTISILGLGMQEALKIVIAVAVLAGSLGVYLLARQFLDAPAALLAGAAYALPPYRLFELYIQGNYPQLLATAIMPYCLLGVLRLGREGERAGFAAVALGMALLGLSHNISAMLFAPLFGAYVLWQLLRSGNGRAWVLLTLAILSGGLAAAFFWLPALLEREYVQTWRLTRDFFDFRHYFLSVPELVALPEVLDLRAANSYFPMSLGGHLLLLAIPSVAFLGKRVAARGHVAFFWLMLAFYGLMTLPLAEPIWARVPMLAYTEFPQRLLSVASLPLALLVGAGLQAWAGSRWQHRTWLALALAVVLLGAGPYLFPRKPFIDWTWARAEDVTQYEQTSGALGTTSAGEYLPRWVEQAPTLERWQELARQALVIERTAERVSFRVSQEQAGQIALPLLYFPDWQATVDGVPAEVKPGEVYGLAQVTVPAGAHEVSLFLQDTSVRKLSWLLSLAGVLIMAAVPALARRGQRQVGSPAVPAAGAAMLFASGAAVVLLLLKVLYIEPHTMMFRRYSPPGTVSGTRHPMMTTFGNRVALLGYDVQRNLPTQGEPLAIKLYWQALAPLDRDWHVVVRLDSLVDGRTFVASEKEQPGGIPSSHWHPALYVEDRHVLELPWTLPAVRYALRVSVYDPTTGETLPGPDGSGAVTLQDVQVLYHLPLDVRRFRGNAWYQFGENIRLIGYRLERSTVHRGEEVRLTLFWRAEAPVTAAMKRFLHLVAPGGGNIVAQWDEWPVYGLYPTDLWLPKHIIADTILMRVPNSAASGRYSLVVGLYDGQTLARPSVQRAGGEDVPERAVVLPEGLTVE